MLVKCTEEGATLPLQCGVFSDVRLGTEFLNEASLMDRAR